MLTNGALAVVAALATAAAVVALRRAGRSDRRYAAVLRQLDDLLATISAILQRTVVRADELRAGGAADRELAPSIERLLERIAAERAPAHAFRRLAGELAPELAGAHRHPKAKQPATRDDLTGVRDRSGYEAELEREIARAHRTRRPLALVLLDLGDLAETRVRSGHAEADRLLQEFAALLVRTTRATDVVCRRRGEQFGILLPETNATGARYFRQRLREDAARTRFGGIGPVSFASGIAEWRPSETGEAFDARARSAVGRYSVGPLDPPDAHRDDSPGTRRAR